MEEPQPLLIDELNPYGSMRAIVEDDGRTIYLYAVPSNNPDAMSAVWIRNRHSAPEDVDTAGMQQGLPPMMPRGACKHPDGATALEPDGLSIVGLRKATGSSYMTEKQ